MKRIWGERRQGAVRCMLAAAVIGLPVLPASAVNILTVGDSTTFGFTNGSSVATGYQVKLKQIIEANTTETVNYVGEYQDFTAFGTVPWQSPVTDVTWPVNADYNYTHFGHPSGDINEVLANAQNVAVPGPTSSDPYQLSEQTIAQRLSPADEPDVIIVHLGLNDISRKQDQTLPDNQISDPTITTLGNRYENLLIELGDQFPSSKILVALIMPKFNGSTPGFSANNTTAYNNTFHFNDEVQSRVDAIDGTGATAALNGRVSTVDLFALSITELATLGMEGNLQSAAQDDADDYVDWGQGYDESSIRAGNSEGQNTTLYSDNVHPTINGYEIEAWGLYAGLQDANFIPEPGTVVLFGGAAMVLVLRRRRAA